MGGGKAPKSLLGHFAIISRICGDEDLGLLSRLKMDGERAMRSPLQNVKHCLTIRAALVKVAVQHCFTFWSHRYGSHVEEDG